jgi:microcystin-dependent protein
MATFKITDLTTTELPTEATIIPCIENAVGTTEFVSKTISIGQIKKLFDVGTVKSLNRGVGILLSPEQIINTGTINFHAPGLMCLYAGTHINGTLSSAIPSGWLLCDGSSNPRTGIYSNLFTAIGTTYGFLNNSSFNLPNLAGRAICGRDNLGGVSANVLTQSGSGADRNTLGGITGAANTTLSQEQTPLAKHSHPLIATFPGGTIRNGRTNGNGNNGGVEFDFSTDPTGRPASVTLPLTISNPSSGATQVGASQSHSNMPPFLLMRYIIKL